MDKFNILDLFTIDTSSPFDFLITSFGFMLALLMLILTITVLYIIIVFYKQVEACLNKQTTRKFQEEIRRIELANSKVHISSLEDAVKRLHRQEEITQLNQQAQQLLER